MSEQVRRFYYLFLDLVDNKMEGKIEYAIQELRRVVKRCRRQELKNELSQIVDMLFRGDVDEAVRRLERLYYSLVAKD